MRKVLILLGILVCAAGAFAQETTQGTLYAAGKKGNQLGACPLKSTVVKTEISGFLARVRVRQEFENSFTEPIEAVYTFPLSQNGAVDDMTMTIGERIVRGKIKRRDEARQIYETAKTEGKTASLLDQERPNIFTQSLANIMPGESVIIEISYVETLKYENGAYEFVFPMTVGPRYIPASVTDAPKISPPIAATRNGNDITMEINLNAGVPVEEIRSTSHEIEQVNFSPNVARISLKGEKTIPNKDLILRYDVTGKRIEDAIIVHRDARGGFFTMIIQPPDKIASEDRTPKEIVFVLDTSGSMYGFPIDKAKEAMKLSLEGLYPNDTFNLITFAGDTSILFDKPVPATQANLERAQAFLDSRQGGGGTEMMKAIQAALAPSDAQDHLRIVCFMTDGYVGNENEIIAEIQKHPKARVFSFGIGSSVNRFLLDKMAEAGRGEVEYVSLTDDGSKAAKKFYERVRTPLFTDLSIDWNGMPVADIYPGKLTDLFSAKPVILHGRYSKSGRGTIKLKGKIAGQDYVREIAVNLPETEPANDVLATLWARTRIDELSSDKLRAANAGKEVEFDKQITNLGLEFRLLTQFTSFVAVEERIVNRNGAAVKIEVPVMIPEGVDPKMAVGDQQEVVSVSGGAGGGGNAMMVTSSKVKTRRAKSKNNAGRGTGVGYGSGSGSGSGSGTGSGSGAGYGANTVGSTTATVEVSAESESPAIDMSQSAITTTITRQMIEGLPAGSTYSSVLKMAPGVRPGSQNGGFLMDGARGSESTFIIDGSEVTNFRTGQTNKNNNMRLTGRTVAVAEPVYPAAARAAKVLGEVAVEVKIDQRGNIVSAKAVSGPELLQKPAESAAMLSKFAPTFADGRPVRVEGAIVYNFKSPDKTEVSLRKMKAQALTADDKKVIAMGEKLHFWIFELVMRLRAGVSEPTPNEAKFVRESKADVQIVLGKNDAGPVDRLKQSGVEIVSAKGTHVSGRVPLEKLAALVENEEVVLIIPKY